jgi:hypothetical protein
MRDDRSPRPLHESPIVDAAIRTLRELPPDNPHKVDQIVAAARAQRGVDLIPNSSDHARRRSWWRQGIGTAAAAAVVFGIGFVAGHFRQSDAPVGSESFANVEPVAAEGDDANREGGQEVELTDPAYPFGNIGGTSIPSAVSISQFAVNESATKAFIPVPTSFSFKAATAKQVAIVGDFNAWDPVASPLTRQKGSDTWTGTISLLPGRHTYAFVIDGRIVPDPNAVNIRDPDYDVIVSTIVIKEPE